MGLLVNGARIGEEEIEREVKRLEPHYRRLFPHHSAAERRAKLRAWAEENLIERVLFHQEAVKRGLQPEKLILEFDDESKLEAFLDELKSRARIEREGEKSWELKLRYLLVKPAGPECNMRCLYCFYLPKKELFPQPMRMGDEVLKETVRKAINWAEGRLQFIWQGGEPTLMGIEFYMKALHWQRFFNWRGLEVENALQTNGLLINRDWAKFLKEADFLVGLSIDGPAFIHNRYRRLAGGQESFRKVAEAAELLLKEGVRTNALVMITDLSSRYPEQIYNFLKEMGFTHMQFIPCVEHSDGKLLPFSVKPEAFGDFLCRLFDLWVGDFADGYPTTYVRFFEAVLFAYLSLLPPDCRLLPECGHYLVVEHNGQVYSCDFYVDQQHLLGNVLEGELVDMLNSPAQRAFGREKGNVAPACRACPYYRICRGGCPRERVHGRNLLCEGYRRFFEYSEPVYRRLAARLKGRVRT